MSKGIKLFPSGMLTISEDKQELIKENLTISYSALDSDNDKWNVGFTSSFILNLNTEEIEKVLNNEKINDKQDVKEVLDTFLKTKKIKIKGKKVLYIDIVLVELIFRGQKIVGKLLINELKEYAIKNDIEYLILKAHPFVTHEYGFLVSKSTKRIKEEKQRLQNFYSRLEFEYLKQKCDLMYFKINRD